MVDTPTNRPADAMGDQIAAVEKLSAAAIPSAQIGVANGVASLNDSALLQGNQIPFGTTPGTVADGGAFSLLRAQVAIQAQRIDLLTKCLTMMVSDHAGLNQAILAMLYPKVEPEVPAADPAPSAVEPPAGSSGETPLNPALPMPAEDPAPVSVEVPAELGAVSDVTPVPESERPVPDFHVKESGA